MDRLLLILLLLLVVGIVGLQELLVLSCEVGILGNLAFLGVSAGGRASIVLGLLADGAAGVSLLGVGSGLLAVGKVLGLSVELMLLKRLHFS